MKDKEELYLKCLVLCSGHFLTKHIPNDWYSLSEDEQDKFLIQNIWQPLENLDVAFVYESIEASADITYNFIINLQGENNEH